MLSLLSSMALRSRSCDRRHAPARVAGAAAPPDRAAASCEPVADHRTAVPRRERPELLGEQTDYEGEIANPSAAKITCGDDAENIDDHDL